MIEVKDLSKHYGRFQAVPGVTFSVDSGNVVGLLGPNGAGKTTIMKMLTAYHRPSSGQAIIEGFDVVQDPVAVKSVVGYLPEAVPLYTDMSVMEYLSFIASSRAIPKNKQKEAIEKSIVSCGLSNVAYVRIEKLSKGYKQRTGLAQAIIHDPQVLILDEPTTGLDPNQILEIRSLIRSLGSKKTVILSTHILQEVEALCSEVLILNEGKIVAQGKVEEIARSMQGEEHIHCVLKNDISDSAILELSKNSIIGSAKKLDKKNNGHDEILVTSKKGEGEDASGAVFDWAVSSGAKILEMRREHLSMEDIFVRLTNENNSEVKK